MISNAPEETPPAASSTASPTSRSSSSSIGPSTTHEDGATNSLAHITSAESSLQPPAETGTDGDTASACKSPATSILTLKGTPPVEAGTGASTRRNSTSTSLLATSPQGVTAKSLSIAFSPLEARDKDKERTRVRNNSTSLSISRASSEPSRSGDHRGIDTPYHARPGYSLTPARTPMPADLDLASDPLAWSDWFKAWANTTYCIMILSTTYGSSAFAPSVPSIVKQWGIERHWGLAGTSMYVLGFALGPFIMAPCSEVFGRKAVYVTSFVFLTLFNVVVAVAPNIAVLLGFRFLAGFMGSSALNNVASSIVDMTRTRDRLRYNTAYRLISFGGPTLGPFLGTWVTEKVGWRWNMRILPMFSFVALLLYALTVPESHRPTLLARQQRAKAKRAMAAAKNGDLEGQETSSTVGEPKLTAGQLNSPNNAAATEKDPETAAIRGAAAAALKTIPNPSLSQRLKIAFKRPFIFLFTEPLVMIVCLYTAILYGLLYGLLGAFPYTFVEIRNLSRTDASFMYLSILLGFTLGAVLIGFWLQDRQFKKAWDSGTYKPETRIGPASWGSFAVPVGLFLFAWTAPFSDQGVHWVVPCAGIVIFAFGMQLTFNSWLSYLGDAYGPQSSSAMAASTFTRSLLGAAFPLFMKDLLGAMTIQGALSMFAGISLPLSVCGVLFVKYGHRIREKSKHAVVVPV